MEPSYKSPAMDLFLSKLARKSREIQIASNLCMVCDGDATSFRDTLSETEYTISGMCQICQDLLFTGSE